MHHGRKIIATCKEIGDLPILNMIAHLKIGERGGMREEGGTVFGIILELTQSLKHYNSVLAISHA
jgi:hypothetical protein